jgi:integrase
VSVVRLFREENTRTRWLTAEEEGKLFAVIPEPYPALCKVALYTGARRGELLAARWDQVDAKRGLLTLPTSKSGKPRHIELSSLVLGVLERIPRHLGNPLIYPDCRKVTHRFPAWAAAAELPGRVTLHTLRHTFASRLVMAGVDLLTVRDLGGWGAKGGLAMVERYAHVAAGHKREAIEALARGERLERTGLQASGT